MSYYKDEVLRDIKLKRHRKENGLHNGIPIPFKKYGDYFPYIERGMYYHILGETGIGKSTFARYMFVYEALKFSWENNYPIKIIYFGLEDGKMLIYKKFIKHYLYERYQITLPQKYLDSKDLPLAKKYLDLLEADCDFYELFEQSVYIVNEATRPSQIEDVCVKVNQKYGETHHIIAIIDNYSNIVPEAHHKSDWDAIRELSRNKIRLNLCKKLQMTVVGILQVDFETVKAATRNVGRAGITAIEPNLSSIGDAKVVSRNSFVVLALFNPNKYDIKAYPYAEGYNIEVLRDRFRSVLMLKNNNDSMAPRLPLYFDGANEVFTELPSLEEKEKLEVIYNKVIQEEKERRDRNMTGQRKMW